MCKQLSLSQPATSEWFGRLNLPLRPILSPQGAFGGVILPPLPPDISAREYQYDRKSSRLIPHGGCIQFEAQFLACKTSPVGETTKNWQWRVLKSLAETVALMHSANLVHGDLSLSNVLAMQRNDTHRDDDVYLIDLDDAFYDNGRTSTTSVSRRSPLTYDPYSVSAQQVSRETDVFLVALWTVAFMQYKFDKPELVAQRVPAPALARLMAANTDLPDVVQSALGPILSRPTALDLYKAIWIGARNMGATS